MLTRRTTEIFSDPRFEIFVLESVKSQATRTATGGYLIGNMEPLAIIVRGPESTVTFDMSGNPTDQFCMGNDSY